MINGYSKKLSLLPLGLMFLVTTLHSVQAGKPDSLELDQVISQVMEKNPLVEQSLHKIEAAQAQIDLDKSTAYPFAAAELSYNRIGPLIELHIPDAGSFSLFPANNYDAHIAAQYTIYDFGKRATRTELARTGLEYELQNAQATRNTLAYQTVRLFYTILFLQQNIVVLDKEIEALHEHLDIAQKKAQTGSATPFDVLTTRVRVSYAENQKVDVENSLQKESILLGSLMGEDGTKEMPLKGAFQSEFDIDNDRSEMLDRALNSRLEVKLASNNVHRFEIDRQLAGLENEGQLKASLMLGVKNGYIPDLNQLKFNWAAGMGLDIPLFDGFATRFREQQAQANLAAAQARLAEVKRQVTSEVNQAVEDVNSGKKKLDAANLQLEQAAEAVSLANKQYEAGVVTNLELLDAHTAQAQSGLQKSKVLFGLVLSVYKLEQALGGRNW